MPGLRGGDVDAFGCGHRDHAGQVVLALFVVGLEGADPAREAGRRRRHHSGIHLADLALFVGGVLVFDDAQHAPVLLAHHAAIAGGILEELGLDGQPAGVGCGAQRRERRGLNQRHVAVENEHAAFIRKQRDRLLDGMAGALRRILDGPQQVGLRKCRAHLLAAVTDHHHDARRLQRARCIEHVREHRPAADGVQNLGQVGAHALAQTGREYDYLERHKRGATRAGGKANDKPKAPVFAQLRVSNRSITAFA